MFLKRFIKNYYIVKHKNTIDKAYNEYLEGRKEKYFKLVDKAEKIAEKIQNLHQ